MEIDLTKHMLTVESIELIESLEYGTRRYVINGKHLDGKGIIRLTASFYGGNMKTFVEVVYHPDYITDQDKKLLRIDK